MKEGAAVLITPSLAYRLIKKGTLGSFGVRGGPRYGRRGPLHRPFRLAAIPLTSLPCSAWLDSSAVKDKSSARLNNEVVTWRWQKRGRRPQVSYLRLISSPSL